MNVARVEDVNFERRVVTFRPSHWRRLKTEASHRSIPLHPQLAEILRAYLSERTAREVLQNRPTQALLFPSAGANGEAMITDFRKVLESAAIQAGFWEPVLDANGQPVKDEDGKPKRRSTVGVKMFRHTYCTARLQTLDQGAPVSVYTVAREMGHGGDALMKRASMATSGNAGTARAPWSIGWSNTSRGSASGWRRSLKRSRRASCRVLQSCAFLHTQRLSAQSEFRPQSCLTALR